LQEAVLAYAAAVETDLVALIIVDSGLTVAGGEGQNTGKDVNLGGVILGNGIANDLRNGLVGDELVGGVIVVALKVYNNGCILNAGLTVVTCSRVILLLNFALTGENDLITDGKTFELSLIKNLNCDYAAVLTKEVEAELESLIPKQEKARDDEDTSTLYARRINFARLRKQGMDIKNAGKAVGVSYTTAKRYEQWRKDNKK
jgi:hypothetical protein